MNEHRGEISIGKDAWLSYFDLEGRYETAVEIDFLIRDASEVWTGLETQCVAGCCGIEAFEFWPEDVQKAAAQLDVASAADWRAEGTLVVEAGQLERLANEARKFFG